MDVFLSIIAKSLTVQVKMRSKTTSSGAAKEIYTVTLSNSIQQKDYMQKRWWLRGTANRKLAEVIVNLVKDMAAVRI